MFKIKSLVNYNFIRNFSSKKLKSIQIESKMKYLNVAEKHDAAKTITKFLSNGTAQRREGYSVYNKIFDFEANVRGQKCKMVMTSVSGHLLNYAFLPSYKGWQNCEPVQLFDAPIRKIVTENGEPIKRTLEREIKNCQGLIIWTDCDREGENIGYEIIEVCKTVRPNLQIYRAKFSEITAASIRRALLNLTQPDMGQNLAVEVRMEMDLRTGAAFTRYQTLRLQRLFPQNIANKLISYGSCQIPTLGFVCERYKEAEDFVSEPFWKLRVLHTIDELTVEFLWDRVRLFDKDEVEGYLMLCLADPKAKVEKVTVKPKNKWRPQPMDTVEMEKLGSRKLKINAKDTMAIAEKLYNQGYISYPRTETNSFSKEINLRHLVEQQAPHPQWGAFANKVLEWEPNPRNGNKSDQAHPPIHPIKLATNLSGNEARIYELIARHFLACVSKDATGSETIVNIQIADEKFHSNGLVIFERNYLDVYPYEKWNAKQIHHYEVGQEFDPTEISMEEGATTAPPLLTEADLIALMEKHGIGTDATHAEHIHKIKERGYIGEVDRGLLVPGTIGMGLWEGYNAMEMELAKPNLRAEFEADLKKVCVREKDPKLILEDQLVKYKEAYRKITERIAAMDEKFGRRINEVPNNRRDDGNSNDRDGNSGGGGGGRRNDDDDDDDDNNGPPPGGNGGGINRNDIDNFQHKKIQQVFKCPKCGIGHMALKMKKDSSGYFLSCLNFPDCKNAIWFSTDAIKEVKLSKEHCNRCDDDANKLEFKFKQVCYLALLNADNPIYTTCIRCDAKFREVFKINIDQVKRVGPIVSDSIKGFERWGDFAVNNGLGDQKSRKNLNGNVKKNKNNSDTKKESKLKVNNKKATVANQKFSKNLTTPSNSRQINTTSTLPNNNVELDLNNIDFDDDSWDIESKSEQNLLNDDFDDFLGSVIIDFPETNQCASNENKNLQNNTMSWGTNENQVKFGNNYNNNSTSNANQNSELSSWGTASKNGQNNSQTKSQSQSSYIGWNSVPVSSANSSASWGTSSETLSTCQFKCPTCHKPAQELTVKKDGPNQGRNFFKCPSNCKFFQWADEVSKEPERSENNQVKNTTSDYNEVRCTICNIPAKSLTVRKDGPNKGRPFHVCSNPNSCGFFQWADEVPTEQSRTQTAQVRNTSYDNHIEEVRCTSCDIPAKSLMVRKDGPNKGRSFYACSNPDNSCGFFKWADENSNPNINEQSNRSTSASTNKSKQTNKHSDNESKKRKCGLCRLEGHTRLKCPRKSEFEIDM